MNESDLVDYIDRLQEWDNNAFGMIILNTDDFLMQQLLIQNLKVKAVSSERWMSSEDFDNLYRRALKKAIETRYERVLKHFYAFYAFYGHGC